MNIFIYVIILFKCYKLRLLKELRLFQEGELPLEEKIRKNPRGLYKFTTSVPGIIKLDFRDSQIPELQLDLLDIFEDVEALQILNSITKLLKER
jgi:hypothetical protein